MTYDRENVLPALEGMKTKADKIRALAKAGYLRTEIAKLLGIRYQHARHVLERSGISLGRTRDVVLDREPVEVEVETATGDEEIQPIGSDYLLSSGGFRRNGQWLLAGDDGFELSEPAPKEPGVYAFVVDDVVCYVGVTLTTLHTRMGHYRRGNENMRTLQRVKGLILDALRGGSVVELLVAIPKPAEWHSMPVNMAAGLEAGLISHILPAWNIRGARR
ncbi:hypothetical protein SAMN05421844_107211 [Bosea robiniae]|uniref:GIY-YIG domain-containing protein n=2 Tax=Bosea robiniae TaxID=1036780 RepID=A0ABY0P581_9HYPH|nr:hypothetical protein SAMN05421844_107211 [Bosea robiniae]